MDKEAFIGELLDQGFDFETAMAMCESVRPSSSPLALSSGLCS